MNHTHRLVWNSLTQTWVAVAEHIKGRGKRTSGVVAGAAAALLLAAPAQAQTAPQPPPVAASALPTGGQVVAGQAGISQSGAAMQIDQGSARAAIDWQSFNIGSGASVHFQQPTGGVALNRVADVNPSQIFGRLTATGQVFLSNPSGVYFAPSASVDVGGLVATTHRIGLEDFMAGRVRFERQGASGSVVNEGELRAALGGYIALLAPEVRNQGTIVASLGTVALAAGEAFELQFDGNNTLAALRVEPSTVRALVDNRSAVLAPGGLIILSAQALDRVQGGVIRNSGTLEATGLQQRGGRLFLGASDQINNSGRIAASAGATGPAGSMSLSAPTVSNSGQIEAAGNASAPAGGSLQVTAQTFTQSASGRLDTSAPNQGGSITLRASERADIAGQITVSATAPAPVAAPVVAPVIESANPSTTAPVESGGQIDIEAPQLTLNTATLDASGARGGQIRLHAVPQTAADPASGSPAPGTPPDQPGEGRLAMLGSTTLSTRGRSGGGGSVTLLGDHIALLDGTQIDASGATGGSTVLVGGDWQGSGDLPQAITVAMGENTAIDVSATETGNAGTAVLWSDIHNARSDTVARGSVLARGGAQGGNGGRVETSGHRIDIDGFRVDTRAASDALGTTGLWLIDPYDYTIGASQAATIGNALNTSSVTVTTTADNTGFGSNGNNLSNGDITVTHAITKTGAGTSTLTLEAARHISLQAGGNITSSGGALNVLLSADSDQSGDGINLVNATSIATNGGWLRFGANQTANINGSTVRVGGDVFFGGSSAQALSTSGGGIDVYGETIISNSAGLTLNSGGGDVRLYGVLNSGNQYTWVDKTGSAGSGSWSAARTEARNGTAGGGTLNDSYLVTITSRLENSIAGLTAGYQGAWIGAWRANPAGSYAWTWADGPEAGQGFFTQSGGGGGTAATGNYANFGSGEPNGALSTSSESVGQFFGSAGQWNDLGIGTLYANTTEAYDVRGYVRETNLAPSALSINAGSGSVTIDGGVGGSKALSSLNIAAGSTTVNGTALVTTGAQSYSGSLAVNAGSSNLLIQGTGITVGGPASAIGQNITLNSNLSTTLAGASQVFKASGNVSTGTDVTLQSNGGAITLWSDADASGQGYIFLSEDATLDSRTAADRMASTHTTGGGAITLAGGADNGSGAPGGYAIATGTDTNRGGVNLGDQLIGGHTNLTNFYSGGGNITVKGRSTHSVMGVQWVDGGTFNAGSTGLIRLEGVNTSTGHGLEIGAFNNGGIATLISGGGSSSVAAIELRGSSANTTGFQGIQTPSLVAQATGSGGITVIGSTGGSAGHGVLGTMDLLSASGDIAVAGGSFGVNLQGGTLGRKAATPVASSSANVSLTGDRVLAGGATAVATSGSLTVQPSSTSFSSALTWPLTNFSLSADVSGLQIGKIGNTANITLASALSVAGPINVMGGDITLNSSLASTTANAGVSLLASGSIRGTSSASITTGSASVVGGNVLLAADTDGSGGGQIRFMGGLTVRSYGGDITLGGGNTAGSGFAAGNAAAAAEGIRTDGTGLTLNASGNAVDTGGNIALRGRGWAGSVSDLTGAWGVGVWQGNTLINSGTGTVNITGLAQQTNTGSSYGLGVLFGGGNATITSASPTAGAISITGDSTAARSTVAEGFGTILSGPLEISATGVGGGVTLNATTGPNEPQTVTLNSNSYIIANGGPIQINATGGAANALFTVAAGGTLALGSTLASNTLFDVTSSTSSVTVDVGNRGYSWVTANAPTPDAFVVNTTGAVSFLHSNSGFDTSWITYGQMSSALTIGKTNNTGAITVSEALTVAGPINLLGGQIALNAGLTTTNTTTGNIGITTTGLSGSAGIALANGRDLTVTQSGNSTYAGVVSGTNASLTKQGGGTLTLSGASTYTGDTNIAAGTLAQTGSLSAATDMVMTGNSVWDLRAGQTIASLTMAAGNSISNTVPASGSSLAVSGTATLANSITTTGTQTYNGAVTLLENTALNTTDSNITFNSTVDSANPAAPKNLTATITPGTTYYWVDWTSSDTTNVYGTISIGADTINVRYTNPQSFFGAQTAGGTNFWTGYLGGAFTGGISPYVSARVANGPATADIIQLCCAGPQTLTFSQSVENLAFSVVSMNGNGYGFNQDFTIASHTGLNGASAGYYGAGNLTKSVVGNTFQLNDGGVNGASVGGNSEPHGTIRFANAFDRLTWNSLSNETWNGFTVGVTGTSANAGTVRFNGTAGSTAALGAVAINAGLQNSAAISNAASLAVSGRTALGANITTAGNQNYASAVTLNADAILTTTSNGSVAMTSTIDGARSLSIQTHGTGDTTLSGSVGGTTALNGLTVNTDALNAGAIALATAGALNVTHASASAITGVISGANATVAKAGAGTLTLSGANTHAGGTTVSQGILRLGVASTGSITNGAVGTGRITVTAGGALDLAGYSLANALTLAGTGVGDSGAVYNSTSTAVTVSGATTLSGDASIKSEAGGALTHSGAINGAHALTIDTNGASADAAFTLSGIVGGTAQPTGLTVDSGTANTTVAAAASVAGDVTLMASGLALNASLSTTSAGDVLLRASQTLTLATSTTVTTTDGNITATAARLLNNNSGATFSAGGIGKAWQVWSSNTNPFGGGTPDVRGGLAFDFKQYGASFGSSTVLGTGNGLLYSLSPSLSIALTGTASKTYDGDTSIALTPANYTVTGALDGDVLGSPSGTATLADANAGSGKTVTVTGIAFANTASRSATGSKPVYGYGTGLSASGAIGTVLQKELTITGLSVANKTYDGGTAASITGAGSLSGLVGSETLTLSATSATFADSNAGTGKTVTATGFALTDGSGLASNYQLASTSATTTANIDRKTLTVTGLTVANKTYDGSATANISNAGSVATGVGSETLALSAVGAAFADANAGIGITATATGYTLANGSNGGLASNYQLADTTATTTANIDRKSLTISGLGVADKTYDGSTAATVTDWGSVVTGVGSETLALNSGSGAAFADANAGAAKAVTASGYTLADGSGLASNYLLASTSATTQADIDRATLTVIANDDARFVIQPDAAGYGGVRYSGFVGGETSAVLAGSATVSRVGTDSLAGTYTGVLQPDISGLSAANYSLQIQAGNYTIVPSGQLLVRVADASTSYGSAASFTIGSVEYDNGGSLVSLSAVTDNGNSNFTVSDGAGASATFTLTPLNAALSGAGLVTAGAYQLGATGVSTVNAVNFSNTLTITGSQSVAQRGLTASAIAGISKVYDGTTAMSGVSLALAGRESGDTVTVAGNGAFDRKNAGTGRGYTLNDLLLGGADAGNYFLTGGTSLTGNNGSITPASLALTGLLTQSRVYDATTIAALTGTASIAPLGADSVQLAGSAIGTFADKNVGTGKAVTVSGVTLAGTDAGNYTLTLPTGLAADITPASLALTGLLAQSRVYDATTIAALTGTASTAPLGADSVQLAGSAIGTFADKNVGTDKAVTVSGVTLAGTDAGNYTLTLPTGLAADITPASLALTGLLAQSRVYDATTIAALTGTASIASLGADSVQLAGSAIGTFTDKNVGTGKAVTVSGVTLAGTDAGNYTLTLPTGLAADITPRALTVSFSGANKVYDGSTAASVVASDNRIAGDLLSVNRTASFADKSVGSGKVVSVGAVNLSGADAGNYTVSATGSTSADITRLASVTWIGGASGNWFDPANWAGGAVPDLSNVAEVVIPAGALVSFDTAGASAPADASGPVNIDRLGSAGGGLTQNSGTLNVGSGGLTLDSLAQSGGTLTVAGPMLLTRFNQSGGSTATQGDFTVNGDFSQGSSGTLTVDGNASITDTSGGTTLGNLQVGGELAVSSTGGDLTQASGTAIAVAGETTVRASNNGSATDITLDGSNNDFGGAFNADGRNVTVTDSIGGLVLGNIAAQGALGAFSTGGNVTQAGGSTIAVAGQTTVEASNNGSAADIALNGSNNNFGGAFYANGRKVGVTDSSGGLVLGNIASGGALSVTSTDGDVTQVSGTSITVAGATSMNAPGWLVNLAPSGNSFAGPVMLRDSTAGMLPVSLSPAMAAAALPLPGDTPPPLELGMALGGSTPLQQGGVEVTLLTLPSGEANGRVVVRVQPQAVEPGFSFALPPEMFEGRPENSAIEAKLENGNPLPEWLRFDPRTRRFTAAGVPANGLPISVVVTIGNLRTVVLITEDAGAASRT